MGNYILESSPHTHSGAKTSSIMLMVIVALLPQCIVGVIFFGVNALVLLFTSVTGCVLFEYLFQKLTKQRIVVGNLSAVVTGLMLALVCPPTLPLWAIILGSLVAIIVAKALFGGIGSNVFNPALAGRAFLFISFPAAMGSTWIVPERIAKTFERTLLDKAGNITSITTVIDTVASATPLATTSDPTFIANAKVYLQYLIGYKAGCIGEVSILLIILSFLFLAYEEIIDIRAPLAMIGSVMALSFVYSFTTNCIALNTGDLSLLSLIKDSLNSGVQGMLLSVLTGGLAFGAVFMATDYATTPVTKRGRVAFGLGCGVITFLIRKFGGYPEGVMFSILIMNAFTPLLNNLTSRMYGHKR